MKSPHEINIAIAEIAGIVSKDQHGKLYHTEKGYVRDCPNYHGSLDAIAPVVRAMPRLKRVKVITELAGICLGQVICLATPDQWCEAVLREAGLWK